ncbi:MAG: response regulator, partial [Pseudomonadota bacterium]
ALKSLNSQKEVDLVMLDYMLPDISGEELLESIRSNHMLDHVPIVIQSGLVSHKRINNLRNMGIQGHLIKPYTKEEIVALINNLIYK